jgi:peptide/nickel transport system permease protein
VQAVNIFDLPTISGVVIFASLMVITFNLIVDLLYAWIDPRIRLT